MFSTQDFQPSKAITLKFVGMLSLKRRVQDWIRQEIVDDDPYDEELLDWGIRG